MAFLGIAVSARADEAPFIYRVLGAREGLAGDIVNGLAGTADGYLWVAGSGGLTHVDVQTGEARSHRRGLHFPAVDLASLAAGPEGAAWGTTSTRMLFRFDGARFESWPLPDTGEGALPLLLGWFASSALEDGAARPEAFVADGRGQVLVYAAEAGTPMLVRRLDVSQGGCRGRAVALTPRRQGGLWVALWDGGIGYIASGAFHCLIPLSLGEPVRWSIDLVEDAAGRLWVGNGQNLGIVRVDPARPHALRALTDKDGLPCDNVSALALHDESLWYVCGAGVAIVALEHLGRTLDGGAAHVLAQRASLEERSPQLRVFNLPRSSLAIVGRGDMEAWVGTERGLVGLARNRAFVPRAHTVALARLTVDGREVRPGDVVDLEGARAEVGVAVELAQPHGFEPSFRVGLWRADAVPMPWASTRARRELRFAGLPPGRHTIVVVPADERGQWRPDLERRFVVTLRPRLHERTWFRLTTLATLVVALLSVPLLRRRQRQQQERLLAEERKRIAQELHDGMGQSLASIGFHVEAAEELLAAGPAQVEPVLARLKGLVRTAQDHTRRAIWDLRATDERVAPLHERLAALVESSNKEGGKTRFVFEAARDAGGGPPERRRNAFVEHELYLIAQEALRNAALHAGARTVTVTLDGGGLAIRDDGEGFVPDDRRQSEGGHFGIVGMRERARRIGAELAIVSRAGAGTKVTVSLPPHEGSMLRSSPPPG